MSKELCKNYKPMTREELMTSTGLSADQVEDFFNRNFNGYDNYVRMCQGKHGLDFVLSVMNGDKASEAK